MGERKLPILYTQEVIKIRKTMILSLGLFVASGFLLLFFLISYGKTRKESEEYIHIRQTYTAIREDIFPALAAPVEKQEPKQLPYITADYAGLRELNPDIVGWIAIPDTPISYPVMQAADNQLYLKRDSSGKKSSNGAVFLDANNSLSPLDQNTILYAHNMGQGRETEMFGPLLLYKEKEYLEAHPYIQFDTHLESHGWWEVFAVLHLNLQDKDFNYLRQTFSDQQAFSHWLDQAKALSRYETGVSVCETDTILTLSTCDRSEYGSNGRFVLMAVYRGRQVS